MQQLALSSEACQRFQKPDSPSKLVRHDAEESTLKNHTQADNQQRQISSAKQDITASIAPT